MHEHHSPLIASLLADGSEEAKSVLMDHICEQIPAQDQASFKAELAEGRVSLDRVLRHLAGRPTWERRVSPSTLDTIRMRVERMNKAIRRRKGATEWTVVAGPEERECLNPSAEPARQRFRIRHQVAVYGPPFPQVKPGYLLVGIISSAYEKGDVRDADGQLLRVVPGAEDLAPQMTAMLGDKHRCSACNSARKRNHIFLATDPRGELVKFGKNCAESYIADRQAVEEMLRFLDATRGRGGLEGEQQGGCKGGWSPCSVVRLIIEICARVRRYVPTRFGRNYGTDWSRWSTVALVIEDIWPWWGWQHNPARSSLGTLDDAAEGIEASDVTVTSWQERWDAMAASARAWDDGERSQTWYDVSAWVDSKQDGQSYWANVQSAMNAQCVTWKTIRLLVSAVGQYWREASKPKELPQAVVTAFQANGGLPMGLAVLRSAAGLKSGQVQDLIKAKLLVAAPLPGRPETIMVATPDNAAQLRISQLAAPSAPTPAPAPTRPAPQAIDISSSRGQVYRDLGEGRVISARFVQTGWGDKSSWMVKLDSGQTVLFWNSRTENLPRRGDRVSLSYAKFKSHENVQRNGRTYSNVHLTHVRLEVLEAAQ